MSVVFPLSPGDMGAVFVGESDGNEESVWPTLHRSRPDLVLVDYHLPHGDGLQLCYRIKSQVPTPKVAIFTAYASPTLSLPATLAKADAVLAASIFHFGTYRIRAVKEYLAQRGVPVRLPADKAGP